jgi:hypothetical protein
MPDGHTAPLQLYSGTGAPVGASGNLCCWMRLRGCYGPWVGRVKCYIEVEVECGYDSSPAEPQTLTYPGCDAELTVTSVVMYGREIADDLPIDIIEHIEQQIIEDIQSRMGDSE